jgi:hypothetical protein
MFIQISLSSKINKNQTIKILELYFPELSKIYYAFSKKTIVIIIK